MIARLSWTGLPLTLAGLTLLLAGATFWGGELGEDLIRLSGMLLILAILCQVPSLLRYLWRGPGLPARPRQANQAQLSVRRGWRWQVLAIGLSLGLAAVLVGLGEAEAAQGLFIILSPLLAPAVLYQLVAPGAVLERRLLGNQLAAMLEAGIALPDALDRLHLEALGRFATRFRATPAVLAWLAFDLRAGSLFSTALANQSYFPEVWPALVRVGEHTGQLPRALRALSRVEGGRPGRQQLLRPMLVAPFILWLYWVVTTMVTPVFNNILFEVNGANNWREVLSLGYVVVATLMFLTIAAVLLPMVAPRRAFWRWLSERLQRLPLFWPLLQMEQQLLCCRTLTAGVEAALPADEIVELARCACSDSRYQKALNPEAVRAGSSLASLLPAGLFMPEVRMLVEYGESNNCLADALEAACEHLQDRLGEEQARSESRLQLTMQALVALFVLGGTLAYVLPASEVCNQLFSEGVTP